MCPFFTIGVPFGFPQKTTPKTWWLPFGFPLNSQKAPQKKTRSHTPPHSPHSPHPPLPPPPPNPADGGSGHRLLRGLRSHLVLPACERGGGMAGEVGRVPFQATPGLRRCSGFNSMGFLLVSLRGCGEWRAFLVFFFFGKKTPCPWG